MNISGISHFFSLSNQLLSQCNLKAVFMDLAILLFNQLFPKIYITENLNKAVELSEMRSIWKYLENQKTDLSIMHGFFRCFNLCCEDTFWSESLTSEEDLQEFGLQNEDLFIDASTLTFGVCCLDDTIAAEPYCSGQCDQCSYFTGSCECDIFDIACIELKAIKDTGTAHDTPIGSLFTIAFNRLLSRVFPEYDEFENTLGEEITRALSFDYIRSINESGYSSFDGESGIFAFPKGRQIFSFLVRHKDTKEWKYYYWLLQLLLYGSCIDEKREIFSIDYWFYGEVFCISYSLSQEECFEDRCMPICILMIYKLFEYVQGYLEQVDLEEKGVVV